jgi:hypothetical protein
VTSTIELDYVGRGDRGGDLVIGSLSTGATDTSLGVQQFDITVKRDSNLEVISSTNNSLQVVNLVNSGTHKYLGAYERASGNAREGDLRVKGDSTVNTLIENLKGAPKVGPFEQRDRQGQQYVDGATEAQYNGYGFTDVKTLNGAGFKGQLNLSAILTANVVDKYLNIVDQAPALANVDNVEFNYTLGSNHDVLDVAISSANLAAAGTTTREDFILNIKGAAGNDVLSTAIYTSPSNLASWNGLNGTDGLSLANANGGGAAWYVNSKANANLTIDGGSGNDVINTFGSGDWKVTLGTGDDTYYADNTAAKAIWVFNTADQAVPNGGARAITNLATGDNASYVNAPNTYSASTEASLYGLKLRVVYQDLSDSSNLLPDADGQGVFISEVIDVPAINKYIVTDLNINQAIIKAINDDPVLSKLLKATDGDGNTLVVRSLVDGRHLAAGDLQVEFAIPTEVAAGDVTGWQNALGLAPYHNWGTGTVGAGNLKDARDRAFTDLLGGNAPSPFDGYGPNPGAKDSAVGTVYTGWQVSTGNKSYTSAFATSNGADIVGDNSAHVSDNIIYVKGGSADKDVVVLSTGANSNDTVKFEDFGNGHVTVVNFDADASVVAAVSATYTVNLTGITLDTTSWTSGALEAAIMVNGTRVLIAEITLAGSAADALSGVANTVIEANIQAALGSGWVYTSGNVLTGDAVFTHTAPGSIPAITPVSGVVVDAGLTADSSALSANNAFADGSIAGGLGDDVLDFTAYGAVWLGVGVIDNSGNTTLVANWDVATYDTNSFNGVAGAQLAHVTSTAIASATTGSGHTAPHQDRDYFTHFHTGDKYITLTHVANAAVAGDHSANQSTEYLVQLWTVNGDSADAYTESTVDASARDTAVTIGYIDVGRVIEGAIDVSSILAQIAY